ncbi:MAG: hypothetical protein WAV47_15510, partial [Blastocatellia bacterium]
VKVALPSGRAGGAAFGNWSAAYRSSMERSCPVAEEGGLREYSPMPAPGPAESAAPSNIGKNLILHDSPRRISHRS